MDAAGNDPETGMPMNKKEAYKTTLGNVKKGDYIYIKERPVVVWEVGTAAGSKHAPNVHIRGQDIFTLNKMEVTGASNEAISCPSIKKLEFIVDKIDADGTVHLVNELGYKNKEFKIPAQPKHTWVEELKENVARGRVTVTVIRTEQESGIVGATTDVFEED